MDKQQPHASPPWFSALLFLLMLFFILIFNGGVHPVAESLLFIGPLALLTIIFVERRTRRLPLPRLDPTLVALWLGILIFSAIAIPGSWSPAWSGAFFLRISALAIFCLVGATLSRGERGVRLFIWTLMAATVVLLIQYYAYLLFGWRLSGGSLSLVISSHGHSHIADVILVVLPIVFGLSFTVRGLWRWLLGVLIVSLFLSFSRTGLVVAFLALLATGIWLRRQQLPRLRRFYLLLGVVGLAFLSLPRILPQTEEALKSYPAIYRQVFKPTSAARRFAYWDQAWQGFISAPLSGTGPGTFRLVSAAYRESLAPYTYSWFAHNWYLQTLSESGLIGFLLWMGLLTSLFWSAWRGLGKRFDPYATGLFVGVLASASHSLVDFDWEFPGIFLSVLLGLGLLRHPLAKRQEEARGVSSWMWIFLLSGLLFLVGGLRILANQTWIRAEQLRVSEPYLAQTLSLRTLALDPLNTERLLAYVGAYGPCCQPFFRAEHLYPRSPDLWETSSRWYLRQGAYLEAATAFERGMALVSPARPELVLELAEAYDRLGEEERRQTLLARWVERYWEIFRSPGEEDYQVLDGVVDVYHDYITLALERGEYEAAFAALSRLVGFPNYGPRLYLTEAFNSQANLILDREGREAAHDFLSRYLAIVIPDSQEDFYRLDTAHRELARLAFSLSRTSTIPDTEEERWLRQAIRLDPWQVRYYLAYGDLLEWYDRRDEAKTLFQQCLVRHPGNDDCELRLGRL